MFYIIYDPEMHYFRIQEFPNSNILGGEFSFTLQTLVSCQNVYNFQNIQDMIRLFGEEVEYGF